MVDFVDHVNVHLKAGNGGNGCASIRREKFKPLAGPNGGNGGNGGSIVLRATDQSTSLLDFHFSRKHQAENGTMGMGGDKDGTRGENLVLDVPVGTVIKYNPDVINYSEDGVHIDRPVSQKAAKLQEIVDFTTVGQEFEICKGGTGGLGNAALSNSQRKAPGFALLGTNGEETRLIFELKLLADVALVGFPSAGKSSIIAAISAARPKIADYPFTTLTPNLGVVSSHGYTYTVADVPGLIPGAAQGKGLGLEFLRHIERTKVIVHVIDMNTYEPGRDPISDLEAINAELTAYDEMHSTKDNLIMQRPQIILLNKCDDHAAKELAELTRDDLISRGIPAENIFLTSAATHDGLDKVKERLAQVLQETDIHNDESDALNTRRRAPSSVSDLVGEQAGGRRDDSEGSERSEPLAEPNQQRINIQLTPLRARNKNGGNRNEFSITQKGGSNPYFEIISEKLRNWVLQTDFANDEAVGYLADRLNKIGVEDELAKAGAQEHDEVRIVTKNTRVPYVITQQEYYTFNYEPSLSAGAEVLFSNKRGEDNRLDMHERSQRMTRKEKREQYYARQDDRTALREQFNKERESGYWADPSFDTDFVPGEHQGALEYDIDDFSDEIEGQ